MSQSMTSVEILNARKVYQRIAFAYACLMRLTKSPGSALCAAGFRRAARAILDAGVGTGCNFVAYPPGVQASGCDASAAMLEKARARAEKLGKGWSCAAPT